MIFPRIKIIFTLACLACFSPAYAVNLLLTDHPLTGKIWDMRSGSYLNEVELLSRITKADVLLLGETHGNPQHHAIQLKLLLARLKSGARPALMMEQLNAENQSELDLALAGSKRDEVLDKVNALIKFSNAHDYQPLLTSAVDNKLPIIAANIVTQKLQPAVWRGYDAYDADEIKRLAVEEVWNEKRQQYLATHMGGAHCGKLRDELRLGLSRSQRLKDALMVDNAVASIPRGIIAIVGSSHARRDIGLPLYFAARNPETHILSIGIMEVNESVTDPKHYLADSATGEVPFDLVWFTARVAREDPCANFNMPKVAPAAAEADDKK